jgi:TetR/AcrR family acrAB operon transcriptional repressor
MVRRTKEEALATREQLLDAAERVFRKRGVGHASLAEVADEAGVTRGAIYWHFQSKADLFQAMVVRAEMPHEASLQRMEEAAHADPMAALRTAALESLLQIARDERAQCVYEVVFLRCEYTEELKPVRDQHAQSRARCYGRLERVLGAAVQRGQLPAHLDVRAAARAMYAFVGGLMRDALEVPAEVDLARKAGWFVDLFLAGLANAPAVVAARPRTTRPQESRAAAAVACKTAAVARRRAAAR